MAQGPACIPSSLNHRTKTDSNWYGTPQWQIEAFRRFQIPEEIQDAHHYPALSKKAQSNVISLNAANLFKMDLEVKRKDLPKDYLSHIKMAYLEEGSTPSHHTYR